MPSKPFDNGAIFSFLSNVTREQLVPCSASCFWNWASKWSSWLCSVTFYRVACSLDLGNLVYVLVQLPSISIITAAMGSEEKRVWYGERLISWSRWKLANCLCLWDLRNIHKLICVFSYSYLPFIFFGNAYLKFSLRLNIIPANKLFWTVFHFLGDCLSNMFFLISQLGDL